MEEEEEETSWGLKSMVTASVWPEEPLHTWEEQRVVRGQDRTGEQETQGITWSPGRWGDMG